MAASQKPVCITTLWIKLSRPHILILSWKGCPIKCQPTEQIVPYCLSNPLKQILFKEGVWDRNEERNKFKKWKNTRGQISQGTWTQWDAAGARPPGNGVPANLGGGASSAVRLLGLAELQRVARKWPWLFILYIPHISLQASPSTWQKHRKTMTIPHWRTISPNKMK